MTQRLNLSADLGKIVSEQKGRVPSRTLNQQEEPTTVTRTLVLMSEGLKGRKLKRGS